MSLRVCRSRDVGTGLLDLWCKEEVAYLDLVEFTSFMWVKGFSTLGSGNLAMWTAISLLHTLYRYDDGLPGALFVHPIHCV